MNYIWIRPAEPNRWMLGLLQVTEIRKSYVSSGTQCYLHTCWREQRNAMLEISLLHSCFIVLWANSNVWAIIFGRRSFFLQSLWLLCPSFDSSRRHYSGYIMQRFWHEIDMKFDSIYLHIRFGIKYVNVACIMNNFTAFNVYGIYESSVFRARTNVVFVLICVVLWIKSAKTASVLFVWFQLLEWK